MAHSFANLLYHIVFATRHREPLLDEPVRPELFAFLAGAVRDLGGIALAVNGMLEHVHLLVKLRPDDALSNVVRTIKARSCAWVHRTRTELAAFAWQSGYGAFSVSQSQEPRVHAYIDYQEKHHRDRPFDLEFRELLRKNGCDVDETFFWE